MKRALFILMFFVSAVMMMAFTIDGLTYEMISSRSVVLFSASKTVSSVNIPDTVSYEGITFRVTNIARYAFFDCAQLSSIRIPNTVTSIGMDAFAGTAIYKDKANWVNGALYIDDCLIKVSKNLVGNYTIKAHTRVISSAAFYGCNRITSITIPNSVTSIGNYAFYGCTKLRSIDIPQSVTTIGLGSFAGTAIYNAKTNWEDGALYVDNCLIRVSEKYEGDYKVNGNTRLIANYAFFACAKLTSITIPTNVINIGIHPFYSCSKLTAINFEGTINQWSYIHTDLWKYYANIHRIRCVDDELVINDK